MAATGYTAITEAARQLGLYYGFTSPTGTSPNITVPGLADIAADDERFRWSYLARIPAALNTWSEWRLIEATDVDTQVVTVSRNFATDPTIAAAIFLVLTPQDWLDALNAVLPRLYYPDRAVVTMDATNSEYNITSSASWLTRKNQIKNARYRNTVTATNPKEEYIPVARFYDTLEVVKVLLPSPPVDAANNTIVIEGRHYHSQISAFTDTINLPLALISAELKVEGLKKAFIRLGPSAKKMFGQAMVLAEDETKEMEQRYLDKEARQDWTVEDDPLAGNPTAAIRWGW